MTGSMALLGGGSAMIFSSLLAGSLINNKSDFSFEPFWISLCATGFFGLTILGSSAIQASDCCNEYSVEYNS